VGTELQIKIGPEKRRESLANANLMMKLQEAAEFRFFYEFFNAQSQLRAVSLKMDPKHDRAA
jgi:hypothetical protein